MCKQHTSEKGLCTELEFDFLVLNRPSVPALKAHCNVLHFALLTLCCSLQDLVTTIKNPVLCLVVLRLAVVFLGEVWKPSREIHSVGKTPPTQPHAQWCGKARLDSFSVSITWCVSVLFDVLLVLCVVEKHGKNHRLKITHRLQFSEVCYGAIREHLQLWCHVSHCISFEGYLNVCCLFLKNTHRGVWYVHGLGPGAYDHRPLR